MTMYEVLKCLYRSSTSNIVDMLNYAVYADLYDKTSSFAVHTGYTFSIQTGTSFELLYELVDHILIYQPTKVIELPCIAGLYTLSHRGRFFDQYDSKILIDKVLFDDSAYSHIITNDNDIYYNLYTHTFDILNEEEHTIDTFPLRGRMLDPLFYFGTVFKVSDEDENEDEDE